MRRSLVHFDSKFLQTVMKGTGSASHSLLATVFSAPAALGVASVIDGDAASVDLKSFGRSTTFSVEDFGKLKQVSAATPRAAAGVLVPQSFAKRALAVAKASEEPYKDAVFGLASPDHSSSSLEATKSSDGGNVYTISGTGVLAHSADGYPSHVTAFCSYAEEGEARVGYFVVEAPPGVRALDADGTTWITPTTFSNARGYLVDDDGVGVANAAVALGRWDTAAFHCGVAEALQNEAAKYTTHHQQFGHLLCRSGIAQKRIAAVATNLYATESIAMYVATLPVDKATVPAAVLKLMANQTALTALNETMPILGMNSLAKGSLWADARQLIAATTNLDGTQNDVEQVLASVFVPNAAPSAQFVAPQVIANRKKTTSFSGVHMNLVPAAVALEEDMKKFPGMLATAMKGRSKDAVLADEVASGKITRYMTELYASAATIYRCTANLNEDETKGYRDWACAHTFCEMSKVRRAALLNTGGPAATPDAKLVKLIKGGSPMSAMATSPSAFSANKKVPPPPPAQEATA